MKIGMLGHGTVGKGVEEIIRENTLFELDLQKILVKDDAEKTQENMVTDYSEIVEDSSIDTIVECIGGLEPAHTYCIQAMEHGKNVVTSNKAMVATFYTELLDCAKKNQVKFYFEASVGGGIPWIHNLIHSKWVDSIDGFDGILNGTTNYILDRMFQEDAEFSDVLKDAQDLGYAERDPASDIDGIDVKYKTCISCNVGFGTSVSLEDIDTFGIRNITKQDVEYCKENGLVCKLLGQAKLEPRVDTKSVRILNAYVQPEFVKGILAHVPSNYNFVSLYCPTLGASSFMGQGAGKLPTGNAILSDLYSIEEKDVLPIYHTREYDHKNSVSRKYYVRTKNLDAFQDILQSKIDGNRFISQPISVRKMHQLVQQANDPQIFVAGVDHD